MSTPPRKKRSNLHRTSPKPEFGDWRVELARPEEAEHYECPPLSIWKRAKLKLEEFENGDTYGDLYRHRIAASSRYHIAVTSTPQQRETIYDDEEDDEDIPIVPLKGFKAYLRGTIAVLLLLPLSIILVHALGMQLVHALPTTAANSSFWLSEPIYFSLLGFFTFLALMLAQFATPILVYLYVLGHELTHALTAMCFFGKVSLVNVDIDGGYIETDTDNVVIALAPYFVPLWLLVWVLLVAGFYLFLPRESVDPWFFGGCGFLWSFHLYWTIWVIPREQPDVLENGILFSLLFVVIMNILILIGILRFFNLITFSGYCQDFMTCARQLLDTITWLFSVVQQCF
jgi:hypothetical protein